MAKIYQLNQRDKLKEYFREHPYFKLCKTVFKVFQEKECTAMVLTPEQLFVDASNTLDRLLHDGDISTEMCQEMWTDKFTQYRERDEKVGGKEDATKTEVAVLFYLIMYALKSVNKSHYRGTLQRTLHDSIFKLYYEGDIKRCMDVEKMLREPVNLYTAEMMAWMEVYFKSTDSLTNEIDKLFHPNKKAGVKGVGKKKEIIYYTLKYNCPDVNTRIIRVNIVMQKMQEWQWIEEPKIVNDFDHFFDGEPRNCNLKWIGKPSAILTELIKLLLKQHYMDKVKGVSARSIVKNQFGLNPSGNKERIDAQALEHIKMIIYILDYKKPLPLPKKGKGEGDDISDLALQAVFAKELHITKDLNRQYE